ncbi:MAG: MBL fold metallo-hydrolase [Glaciecola sp.]
MFSHFSNLPSMSVWGIFIASIFSTNTAFAQDRFAKVQITTQAIANNVYMLVGSGGNIGVSAGHDGILIIDDQYAPLAPKIQAALGELSSTQNTDEIVPVKYVINTHFHGDHVGGNAHFHDNNGATIFAHHNVRVRLLDNAALSQSSLPVVTYDNGISIHMNEDKLNVMHFAGHTDGDSVVLFEEANVLHTGDLFFNGLFPYVDLDNGGNVQAYIDSVNALITQIDEQTKIIPGHGPLATKADYQAFVSMMEATYNAVKSQKAQGMTLAEVLKVGVAEEYASYDWRFITEPRWLTTLYHSQ